MILPINNISINKKPQIQLQQVSIKPQVKYTQLQQLNGMPRSYISFGSIEDEDRILRDEERRRALIAKYLEYKSWNPHVDYEQAVKNEIVARRNEGHHKILGIPYVKASEKLTIREKHRQNYEKQKAEYEKILANESYYQNLLKTDEIKVYEKVKELLEKIPASINNTIAGYQNEKKQIRKILIDPIHRETALETTEKIPPALVIYGPIRCGKTELAKGIAKETGCNVEIIENEEPQDFINELLSKVKDAKRNYQEVSRSNNIARSEQLNKDYLDLSVEEKANLIVGLKSPRTIIVVDDVDRYFNPKTAGNNEDLIEHNKTILKGLLDHCSEKPNDNPLYEGAGVSFIFTSNYPSILDSEVFLRRGKCEKLPIAVPNKDDIVDIAKFYLKNGNQEIQKAIDEGRDIDLFNIDEIQFDKYEKFVQPTNDKGALSGAGVKKAVEDAIDRYIENPDNTVGRSLPKFLASKQYRISPEKLQEFKEEMIKMGLLDNPINDFEEYELLKDAEKFEMLTPTLKARLTTLQDVFCGKFE